VGGPGGIMYGNIIQGFFTRSANWPLGSAMAMIMLTLTLLIVAVAVRVIDVRRVATT
jgi:spermidine/putrescine transport system permease protein